MVQMGDMLRAGMLMTTGFCSLVVCFALAGTEVYQRPTAEEALTFLQSLPPVARKIDGKKQMVQEWKNKTANDIRTMTEIAPGGHIESGDHFTLHGKDWRYFTAFENLKKATLYEIHGVSDEAFYHMGHLSPTVTYLFVEGGEFTDKGVKELQRLKNLEFLGIGWNKGLDDAGVAHMAELPNLTEVLVSGCKGVKGPGIERLAKLKKLKTLKAAGTSITDSTLVHLKKLGVEELYLGQNDVTSNGLKTLLADRNALKNLKTIELKKVNLTAEDVAELQRLRPGVKIDR